MPSLTKMPRAHISPSAFSRPPKSLATITVGRWLPLLSPWTDRRQRPASRSLKAFAAGSASFAEEQNIDGQRKDCECDEPKPVLKTPMRDPPFLVGFVNRCAKFGL